MNEEESGDRRDLQACSRLYQAFAASRLDQSLLDDVDFMDEVDEVDQQRNPRLWRFPTAEAAVPHDGSA